ncbi:MAG: DUF1257 domain-containing protein [Kaiparowitsia implicata GSE-PSE-MK54-09C]|jgi:hypothetical protein|nr:DUF1257 domain-containing protein [Kaiparowitsia implicata GSE-PSE-MK54-09C]
MSHFSQIKTKLRDLSGLQSALTDVGADWKAGPSPVRGYQGQTVEAELVIEQSNGYDLGFRWTGQDYELVADLQYWNQPFSVEGFLNRVNQRYAYHTVKTETARSGFQVTEEQRQADGSIRLVLSRWSA